MRKKKTEDEAALTPEASTSRERLTPADIQQAEFRLSMRGYNEREVDELLDRLTEDWGAVLEENKRLRDQSGPVVAAAPSDTALADSKREADAIIARARQEAAEIVRNASQATPAAAPADAAEAAAVSSFLNKERDFLQSLGRLVQGHAESVKSMAQGAKAAESKPAARSAPGAQSAAAPKVESAPAPKSQARTPEPAPKSAAQAPAPRGPKQPEPDAPQKAPQTPGAPTQPVVKIDAGEEVPEPAPQTKAAEPQKAQSAPAPSGQASPQPVSAKQPAPIRIPEGGAPQRSPAPTPAQHGAERSGDPAQNRDEELSLRELFWGDE
jgi:DivIVA domain-containing protein